MRDEFVCFPLAAVEKSVMTIVTDISCNDTTDDTKTVAADGEVTAG